MIETITEPLIAALAKAGADTIARRLALGPGGKSNFRQDPSGEILKRHLHMISQWASNIAFMDLKRARSLREGYIDLDLKLAPE